MNRRDFLALALLPRLRPVSRSEARVEPSMVRFDPRIEPLVRLLEETPRGRLLEEVAARIGKGLSYRDALAGLLLAGIRNIEPRPSVGFKFHAVLVVHSAHLVAQAAPDSDRWLPLLWALDHFKESQATDARQGDWTMPASTRKAIDGKADPLPAFTEAMENWDEAAADAAAGRLAGSAGPDECFEAFARYAARDVRSIGHKAIYVANGWRTLETIGWQHVEAVLRSLAFALLAREGSDPLKGDDRVDRPWRRNRELARRVRAGWPAGKADSGASAELLASLREGSDEQTADSVVALLNRGIAPESIWDALMCGAVELLMREPGIVALHAVTTTNALRYLYERSATDETRRLLLLQNASFLPFYRRGRGSSEGVRIDGLAPREVDADTESAVREICADIGRDNPTAAGKVLGYLRRGSSAKALIDAANRLVFLKGNDSHDYKFSAAVLEDYHRISPSWRDRYLAGSVYWLNGLGAPDNDLVLRAREALTRAVSSQAPSAWAVRLRSRRPAVRRSRDRFDVWRGQPPVD